MHACVHSYSFLLIRHPVAGPPPDGELIDAFEVEHAHISSMEGLGVSFALATSLPQIKSFDAFDVVLASGPSGGILVCKIPPGATVRTFVHDFCHRVSIRYVHSISLAVSFIYVSPQTEALLNFCCQKQGYMPTVR